MPSEKVSPEEVLRSAQFDLLRQLQKAVRTVILTATVSNSCVNCSHSLCGQLFRLIRSCLLAGCRRFHGAKLTEDFLFLLVVPEFVGAFKYDLEFIAHLCVSHNVGSFVRQLFEDSRANHFYCDCAIMRDEELHLAFVSSLMALEPVNFHPDSPDLAQQCLSASLDNLRLVPAQWIFKGSGKLEDHVPASRPDKAVPKSDIGALRSKGSKASMESGRSLLGFIRGGALPQKPLAENPSSNVSELPKEKLQEEPQMELQSLQSKGEPTVEPAGETSTAEGSIQGKELPEEILGERMEPVELAEPAEPVEPVEPVETDVSEKLEEVALALNETEELVRQLEADQSRWSEGEPLPAQVELEQQEALLSDALLQCLTMELEDHTDSPSCMQSASDDQKPPGGDLPGSEPETKERPKDGGSAADLGMDIADAFGMGLGYGPPVPQVDISVRDIVAAGQRARHMRLRKPASVPEEEPIPASPAPSQRRSRSPAEGDEALDVIASLEGLWLDSRKDTARRLMRASISSMTSQNSVSSTSSLQGHATAMPHLLRLESSHSGNISDSDSESSSRQSVSTSTSITGSQAEKLPPFMSHGVHLEWKLKMHPRPPKDVQVSRQRGLCPECRERLPSSLFHGPRYCHYLGYYFCTNCHNGDIRVIPARVAERWDFEPRKVCSAVAKYLDLQVNQALVPITSIRQTKVSSQQILTEIHTFRQKLSRIKGVVADYGCSFQEELSHSLAQLDAHVARGHDFYAMQDLIRIEIQGKNCPLYTNISRCVMDCAKHIHSCPTCSQCAEQCPICASPTPVYPFEIETFHACNKCKKAFHKACFRRAGSSCPFCLEGSTVSHAVSVVQAR